MVFRYNYVAILYRFWYSTLNKGIPLESGLAVIQSPCEFIHDLYIAEIYRPGAIFLQLVVMSIFIRFCTTTSENPIHCIVWDGALRLFKVIENGTQNQIPVCDFLLVFHCNYMPVLDRFRDITNYWSKICFLSPFYTYPSFVWSHCNGFSSDLQYVSLYQKKIQLEHTDRMLYQYRASVC